ncbi:MAG TPA: PstS family phosphate ABC transporter substrate-binding protein [Alphaproteobacteria bacterium]|nr:PstS family phosphate ABC transporter substrate-binding protein [Alphaproteobacteria bacterium]
MRKLVTVAAMAGALVLAACGGDGGGGGEGEGLAGRIQIDGSSTVYPVSQAMAEEFMLGEGRNVRVTASQSGTGGGFSRFCAGETQISDASRPIKDSERERCEANGIEPVELEVAMDGITVVVNPQNDFAQCMTVEELRRIWEPGSEIQQWSDVRSEWPNQDIKLYGPGTDSGTFDYFTEAVMGEEDRSRQDYTASEDDNVLVQGVAGDPGALGYFGYAYYEQNTDQLKALAVDAGSGCVAPSRETIASGEYAPLARPMFIYVAASALERPEVRSFVRFYMESAEELVPQTGYVPLDASAYQENLSGIEGGAGDS